MRIVLRKSVLESVAAGFVLLLLGRAFVNFFLGGKNDESVVLPGGDAAVVVLQAIAYGGALLLVLGRLRGVVRTLLHDLFPILFAALVAFSIVWSVSPSRSVREAVAVLVVTLFGAYLASRFSRRGLVLLLAATTFAAALLSTGSALVLPEASVAGGSHEGAWIGIFDHKNTLGMRLSLGAAIFPLLWVATRRWRRRILGAGLVVVIVLVATRSLTSLVTAATVVLLMSVLMRIRRRPLESAIAASTVPFVAVLIILALPFAGEQLLETMNPRGTFSDRIEQWQALGEEVGDRPLLGYGVEAFWQNGNGPDAEMYRLFPWGPNHAHNGFVEMLLDLGWLGTAAFVLHLAVMMTRAFRDAMHDDDPLALWPLLFLVWYLLSNVTYSNLGGQSAFYWTLYSAVALQSSRRSLLFRRSSRTSGGAPNPPIVKEAT